MAAHTTEQFNLFMSQLWETNAPLNYYCDFEKIKANVANIEISLNTLNFLIGKDNLREAVETLWARDPRVFDVMDILIATRKSENKKFVDTDEKIYPIHSLFSSVDGIMKFLEGTGLEQIFHDRNIKNLVDYVFGVETGLDTNARKNRGGSIMETLVAKIFANSGIPFREQVSSKEWPSIKAVLGTDEKRFDFVVETTNKTYLIETNFYTSQGSKLNETARSYTELGPKVNGVPGFEFVWITDGIGWNSARNKLEEAFAAIPSIYNLTTISEFITKVK